MKRLILIPLTLILVVSCQKKIGETKLGSDERLYKKYVHFSTVSIFSDKSLNDESLVTKIDSLNSLLMVNSPANKLDVYEIYDADSLFVGYTNDTLYDKRATPTYILVERFYKTGDDFYGDEAIKYMTYMSKIFIELNKSIYNPMGYQPGYESSSSNLNAIGPLILWEKDIFDLEFYKNSSGKPRYKNYEYAQNSDFGEVLEEVIGEYVKKDIDTLYIDTEFWRGMRRRMEQKKKEKEKLWGY